MNSFTAAGVALTALVLVWVRIRRRSDDKPDDPLSSFTGKQFTTRYSDNFEDFTPALPTLSKQEMRSRLLFTEPETKRFALELILGPNQHYPAHVHGSSEWIFCVEGEISDQFSKKGPGDFFYNEKHSLHYEIKSGPQGCRLLVVKDAGSNTPLPQLDGSVGEQCCGCSGGGGGGK